MSTFNLLRVLTFSKNIITPLEYKIQANSYAIPGMALGKGKKMMKGKASTVEKKVLPVETDPYKLVKYVCGTNLLQEGGQDIEIKPDSEYPDWLWEIRTGPAPTLEELDPNTKQYWRRLRKEGIKRNNKLNKLKKF